MTTTKLKVPHVSQQGNRYKNDCGAGSAASVICSLPVPHCPTIDEVIIKNGATEGKFTTIGGLMAMCSGYGAEMDYSDDADLSWYKRQIANGHPCIALLDYRPLIPFTKYRYEYAHFSPITGFDDLRRVVTILDTLTREIEIPFDVFEKAIGTPSQTGGSPNYAYQAITTKSLRAEVKTMATRRLGVNLEPWGHPNGMPKPALLKGLKYVRMPVKISNAKGGEGNLDWDYALDVLIPYLNDLIALGITPILIFGHQAYGEAVKRPSINDYAYHFGQMYSNQAAWNAYMNGDAELPGALKYLEPVIKRFSDELNGDWIAQWWNEQDAAQGAAASVPMPPGIYGSTFRPFYSMVKRINSRIRVITGGHMQGMGAVIPYVKAAAIPNNDGIAWHPYEAGSIYSPHLKKRNIEPDLNMFANEMPNSKLVVTEACGYPQGVNRQQMYSAVSGLARVSDEYEMILVVYPGHEGGQGMAGFIDNNTLIKVGDTPLINALIGTTATPPPTTPAPEFGALKAEGTLVLNPTNTILNIRTPLLEPSTKTQVLGAIYNGVAVRIYANKRVDAANEWSPAEVFLNGKWVRCFFASKGTWKSQVRKTVTTVTLIDI